MAFSVCSITQWHLCWSRLIYENSDWAFSSRLWIREISTQSTIQGFIFFVKDWKRKPIYSESPDSISRMVLVMNNMDTDGCFYAIWHLFHTLAKCKCLLCLFTVQVWVFNSNYRRLASPLRDDSQNYFLDFLNCNFDNSLIMLMNVLYFLLFFFFSH